MNIRTLTASLLVLGTLASGALAGTSNFISTGVGLSDAEVSFNAGRNSAASADVAQISDKAFAVIAPKASVGDYVDETAAEANQRSSNR